jgi:hypothetical protein
VTIFYDDNLQKEEEEEEVLSTNPAVILNSLTLSLAVLRHHN